MTAHDPQLTLQDHLPWHFARRADDADDDDANFAADDAEDQAADYSFADAVADEEEGVNLLAVAVVAASVVVGIGIGAGATLLLTPSHRARPPPAVVASLAAPAPKPAGLAIAPAAPPVDAVEPASPAALGAAAVAPTPAAKSAAPRAYRSAAAPTRLATACDTSGGQRETLICAWPSIAAADRQMRRAYQHALDVGVDRSALQASQARWSTTSEFAARRSAADLTAAYHRRISELTALAANEPPH